MLLAQRRMDIQIEKTRRILEAAKGAVDFIWIGEDLGTQTASTPSNRDKFLYNPLEQ
jgi:hypothetical protein